MEIKQKTARPPHYVSHSYLPQHFCKKRSLQSQIDDALSSLTEELKSLVAHGGTIIMDDDEAEFCELPRKGQLLILRNSAEAGRDHSQWIGTVVCMLHDAARSHQNLSYPVIKRDPASGCLGVMNVDKSDLYFYPMKKDPQSNSLLSGTLEDLDFTGMDPSDCHG